jgi:hypothetical protein
MGSADDPFFAGAADKLYYSQKAKDYVEALEEGRIVSGKVDAYQLGLAIGLRAGVREPTGNEVNFGNLYSLPDEWVIKALMFHAYPDEEPRARATIMHEHAEAGIRILYEHWRANGAVDWQALIHGPPTPPRIEGRPPTAPPNP